MNTSENALIEEQFRAVERRLVEVIGDFGYLKGRSTKTSRVMAYVCIYKEVTQQRLRKLTGYSLGTVSVALRDLEKLGFVIKRASSDSRGYVYGLAGPFLQVLSRSMRGFQDYLSQMRSLLEEVEAKLSSNSLSKKQGYSSLKSFLNEMNVIIPAYQQILQKFQATPLSAGEKQGGARDER